MEQEFTFSIGVGGDFKSIRNVMNMIHENHEFSSSDVVINLILQDKECYETGKIRFQNTEGHVRKIVVTSKQQNNRTTICGSYCFVVKNDCKVTFKDINFEVEQGTFLITRRTATLVIENVECRLAVHKLPRNVAIGIRYRSKRNNNRFRPCQYNNWIFRNLYEDVVDELKFSYMIKEPYCSYLRQ